MKIIKYLVPALLFIITITNCSCFGPVDSDPHLPTKPYIAATVTGFYNHPLQSILATVNNKSVYTDMFGNFSFRDLNDVFDVNINDPVREYNIIYKDVTMCDSRIHLPLSSNQNADTYTINVLFPTIQYPEKGKLYYISNSRFVTAQNIDSSSTIVFQCPIWNYPRGRVVFISYTTDNEGKINAYKYYGESEEVSPKTGGFDTIQFSASQIQTVGSKQYTCSIIPPIGSSIININLVFNFNFGYYYTKKAFADINSQTIEKYSGNNFTLLLPTSFNPHDFKPLLNITTNGVNGYTEEMKLFPSGSSGDFNLTGAPRVTSPPDYAVNVDSSTVFSIQKQNISNVLIFTLIDSIAGKSYNLCTSDSSITMSMLSKMVSLTPNKTYSYTVQQIGVNIKNVTDYLKDFDNLADYKGTTPVRHFTTKPQLIQSK